MSFCLVLSGRGPAVLTKGSLLRVTLGLCLRAGAVWLQRVHRLLCAPWSPCVWTCFPLPQAALFLVPREAPVSAVPR